MHTNPVEAIAVHVTMRASAVPESAAEGTCAVSWCQVVVAVIRAEQQSVVVPAECIVAGVTRVPSHLQLVVVCLGQYSERTVLGVVPVAGVAT